MPQRDNAAYLYTDRYHRPVLMKIRREGWSERGNKFRQKAAVYRDGRLSWKGGRGCFDKHQPEWAEKAMYHLPALLSALQVGAPIYFCEGERDCDTGTALWGLTTTTNWQGARAFTIEQAEWFTWFGARSKVRILLDNDEPGHAAGHLRRIRLIAAGVEPRRIQLYRLADLALKDLTDLALSGLDLGAYERVRPSDVRERAAQYTARQRTSGLSPLAFYRAGDGARR